MCACVSKVKYTCALCSLNTMHFHKMPQCPQDALCSLNSKMHGIGGDGLAFQAARKRRPLPSTRSHNDKTESGRRVIAQRAELDGELHLLFSLYMMTDASRLTSPLVQTLGSCS